MASGGGPMLVGGLLGSRGTHGSWMTGNVWRGRSSTCRASDWLITRRIYWRRGPRWTHRSMVGKSLRNGSPCLPADTSRMASYLAGRTPSAELASNHLPLMRTTNVPVGLPSRSIPSMRKPKSLPVTIRGSASAFASGSLVTSCARVNAEERVPTILETGTRM